MAPYWIMFLIPAFFCLTQESFDQRSSLQLLKLVTLVFVIAIGYRHQVGGDWGSYLNMFFFTGSSRLSEIGENGDFAYYLVNWIFYQVGGSIYWVNTLCGFVLMLGIYRLLRQLEAHWVGLVVAAPYLIFVVGMGYTRQAAALGCVLIAITAMRKYGLQAYIVGTIFGALFHKTAVLMLAFTLLMYSRNRWLSFLFLPIILYVGYSLFIMDSVDSFWQHYVEANYHSYGGLIRVLMSALAASIIIWRGRRYFENKQEYRFWTLVAYASIACIPLVYLSSTATDRVALYFIPIQIVAFSKLVSDTELHGQRVLVSSAVVLFYSAVLFIWLNYAVHTYAWVPYQNLIFM